MMSAQAHGILHDLLMELFSPGELYRLLYGFSPGGLPLGKDLLDNLKRPEDTSKEAFVFSVSQELLQRGLLTPALFERLRSARALQAERIAEAQQELASLPPAPRVSTRQRHPRPGPANPFAPFKTFVGRTRELAQARAFLEEGRAAVLIAGRRAGKTALLGQLGELEIPSVRLDVAAWSLDEEASVYHHMGAALGRPCEDREGVAQLIDHHDQLALIIDEADRLLGQPWTHDVFTWLRQLNDTRFRHRLSFLLVGGPELWRYRNPHDNGSPALNTARWIFMEPLSLKECGALIDQLGQPIDRAALLAEARGHPWLMTEILARVWDGVSLDEAINAVAEAGLRNFSTWEQQLGSSGVTLALQLASTPTPLASLRYRGALWEQHGDIWPVVRALCIADSTTDPVQPGPGMFLYWLQRRHR